MSADRDLASKANKLIQHSEISPLNMPANNYGDFAQTNPLQRITSQLRLRSIILFPILNKLKINVMDILKSVTAL